MLIFSRFTSGTRIDHRRGRSSRPRVERLEARLALATYFVATSGNNANPGTLALPFATVQRGLNAATSPGDTVEVRGGTYHEKVTLRYSGSASGGPITLEAYPGEFPILDGQGVGSSDVGYGNDMVQMNDVSYVAVTGFEIINDLGLTNVDDGSGVRITGAGTNIVISHNTIHAILGTGGAMGITVYGSSLSAPLSDVTIDDNLIDDCTPGQSEALTLNGNVANFAVTGNTIHDVNNIGIDMIGGEYSIFGLPGPRTGLPVARDGICADNTVYHASSGSPVEDPAGGIYVDGGQSITVADNRSFQNDFGIEIGAENRGYVASGIVVENNLLYANKNSGLAFGGYQKSVGRVQDCDFINNTLSGDDTRNTGDGELLIQWASNNVVTNNNISARAEGVLIGSFVAGSNVDNTLNHNIYTTPAGARNPPFNWNGKTYASFAAYESATHEDAESYFNPEDR